MKRGARVYDDGSFDVPLFDEIGDCPECLLLRPLYAVLDLEGRVEKVVCRDCVTNTVLERALTN